MRILMLDIDTLRPDHMSCYGYDRETTPNLDAVCRDGLRFDRYYCSDAPCLPSRAALVSGMFGIRSGAVGHGGTAADRRLTGRTRDFSDEIDAMCFHNIFRRAGLHTVSVSTFAERHSSWWFNAGFHECYNVGDCGLESGEEVLPVALDWLNRRGEEDNWFLHVHFWDPHTPYRAPASFGDPFEKEPFAPWITPEVFERHRRKTGPHSLHELDMFDDAEDPRYPREPGKIERYGELRRIFDGYDCGVRYMDSLVGQLLDWLRAHQLYDDTAILVTSDHGENLGELGIYSEHGTADEATCHIPFLLKWPGGVRGVTDSALHYSLDLLPTLAELLGVEKSERWDGESYAETIRTGAPCGRESLVLSQMAHVCQRSARFGDWLYIRTLHDGFHLFGREMLFRISDDPHEQHDVSEQYPEICAQGAKRILDWHDEQMLRSDSPIDPLWTVIREGGPYHAPMDVLPAYLKRLEETGRAEGAAELRRRYQVR